MVSVYTKTKTKLGYVFVRYDQQGKGECFNVYKSFNTEQQVEAHLESIMESSVKHDLDQFCRLAKWSVENPTYLDETAIKNLTGLHKWSFEDANDGSKKKFSIVKSKILEYKPYFVSVIKSATSHKEDLIMLYKFVFNECKE